MASATPQKRVVSSVFITLASPYKATITQHQHTRTHSATANDMLHTDTQRVGPEDSSTRKPSVSDRPQGSVSLPETAPSETQGRVQKKVHNTPPSLARTSERGAPPSQVTSDLSLGLGAKKHSVTAPKRSSGDLAPSSPTLSLVTEVTEDPACLLPPPPTAKPHTPPCSQHVSPDRPPVSDQLSAVVARQPEQSTPSGGRGPSKLPQWTEGHPEQQLETAATKDVCGFCRKPVALSETAIEALNRTYHAACFQCRQCHIPLAGKMYYNKAGIPLCDDCYQASLELCWACGEIIKDQVIRALERVYHPTCFICSTCSQQIGEQRFAQGEVGEVYCLQDYYRKYAPQCSACQQLIIPREDGTDSFTVECLGRSFHEDCYRCEVCSTQLSPEPNDLGCHPLDGRVLCKSCHLTMVQSVQL
ncbi:hypothetical protein UPYG_G00165500 [Umbra pygmaea]|uniref:LIM zinc-binding domain-containing protein n=1 Tax=Umbra pygmaea TaxID=75934 RepID=A0ABD0WMU7_UMBPY